MSTNSKAGGGSRASDEDARTSVKVGECHSPALLLLFLGAVMGGSGGFEPQGNKEMIADDVMLLSSRACPAATPAL